MIIIIAITIWVISGNMAWRLRYYGLMKTWYQKYGFKENLAEESPANHWTYGIPIVIIGGMVSLALVLQYEDVAWYFKQPTNK